MFALIKFLKCLTMVHVGSKTRSRAQILENLVYALEAIFSVRYALNLVRMFALMKSWMSLKMAHVGLKTRSLGHLKKKKKKPSVPSRGHIFNLILMKLGQNICLDEISDKFKNGS